MANNVLYHHGILGQKWGVRRYQNKDGSLTNAVKKRYDDDNTNKTTSNTKNNKSRSKEIAENIKNSQQGEEFLKRGRSAIDVLMNGDKDWMGNSISDDNATREIKNRGKAALERLMYSESEIEDKKFFGSYHPFG